MRLFFVLAVVVVVVAVNIVKAIGLVQLRSIKLHLTLLEATVFVGVPPIQGPGISIIPMSVSISVC